MPKAGILHDYDLHANLEESSKNQNCAICGAYPMSFQWSDYSGEAMCTKCGCPYQLTWGSDEQKAEGKYPYLKLNKGFVVAAKEYWDKKQSFVCYGLMIGNRPGMSDLVHWLAKHHPEHVEKKELAQADAKEGR